jgi:hypothetical protein
VNGYGRAEVWGCRGSSASADVRSLGLGEDFRGSESHCCDVVGCCLGTMGGMAALGVGKLERGGAAPSSVNAKCKRGKVSF